MKQFKNLILAGALVLGLAGFAVSCDKYGDDIDSLQTQVDAIKADLQALQAKVDAGKYVTNVSKSGDGIVITWNDNSTSTIETIKGDKGDAGAAGTVVTIVDGYWAFDGVKSEYPAVGPKGEQGEPGKDGVDGTNGADGHDVQVSEDGYWMVWDAEAGEYVKTAYIAGGVRVSETTGGYNLTVRDENGVEQTIFVPTCPALVGIEEVRDDKKPLDIFYGVVYQAVDWDGTKGGADKKMQTGMYPVLEEDVKVMLNPTGVDATAYRFDFRASDNKELWGLTFNDMVPYAGDKLLATRAVSSENGIWELPREVARVELNELNARADYVTQFKQNDGSLYAFALNATSKTDASKVIKSQYIYSFDPKNIGVPGKDISAVRASYFSVNYATRHAYVWNEYHKPDFKHWTYVGGAVGDMPSVCLDQVIYDYKIEIDRTRMTQVDIDKYGLEISEDGYYFRTTKEASIDNFVDLKISFILLNGDKATQTYRVYITAKDLVITDTNIGTINEPFNAVLTSGRYVLGAKELAFNPKEVLGANYDEWVDAMFNLLYNQTDADKADNLKAGVSILGGDPINNDATYNDLLVKNFLYIDYVDAGGRSCIYSVANDKVLSRLADIAALKVYFIAGTYHPSDRDPYVGKITNLADNTDDVIKPFYTVSGNASYNQGFAIPLDNAFSVRVAAEKEEYEVAAFTFKFQLTQPTTLDITRPNDKWTVWSGSNLISYGAYGDLSKDLGSAGRMFLPMYEAFEAWDTEYTKYDDQARYYWLKQVGNNDVTFLGDEDKLPAGRGSDVSLYPDLQYTSTWIDWNTYADDASVVVTTDAQGNKVENEKEVPVDAWFHHYGVYPEPKVKGFTLTFASLLNHSTLKMAAGKESLKVNTGTHDVFISNDDLDLRTPKEIGENKFFLFDDLNENENVVLRKTLNETSFNEEQRGFMTVDEILTHVPTLFHANAKENPLVTYNFTYAGEVKWTIDPQTGKRTYKVEAPDGTNIKIYKVPAKPKVKDTYNPHYVLDPEHTMIGGHTGGIVIQLPTTVADQEEVEITLTVQDYLGFTKNLTFTVKKIK